MKKQLFFAITCLTIFLVGCTAQLPVKNQNINQGNQTNPIITCQEKTICENNDPLTCAKEWLASCISEEYLNSHIIYTEPTFGNIGWKEEDGSQNQEIILNFEYKIGDYTPCRLNNKCYFKFFRNLNSNQLEITSYQGPLEAYEIKIDKISAEKIIKEDLDCLKVGKVTLELYDHFFPGSSGLEYGGLFWASDLINTGGQCFLQCKVDVLKGQLTKDEGCL